MQSAFGIEPEGRGFEAMQGAGQGFPHPVERRCLQHVTEVSAIDNCAPAITPSSCSHLLLPGHQRLHQLADLEVQLPLSVLPGDECGASGVSNDKPHLRLLGFTIPRLDLGNRAAALADGGQTGFSG